MKLTLNMFEEMKDAMSIRLHNPATAEQARDWFEKLEECRHGDSDDLGLHLRQLELSTPDEVLDAYMNPTHGGSGES